MNAGEWIGLAAVLMTAVGGFVGAGQWVISRIEKRFDEMNAILVARVSKLEGDTDELKVVFARVETETKALERDTESLKRDTQNLKEGLIALKTKCKVLHGEADSASHSDGLHISQLKREVV